MARPTKYTQEVVKTICDALARGGTHKAACELAGISSDAFEDWMADKAEFSAAVKAAEAQFEEWRRNGLKDDAIKSLKTLICGGRYKTTKTVYENDGNGQPRIKQQIIEEKETPPSATAIIFALCNVAPDQWRQRVEQDVRADVKTTEEPQPNKLAKVPTELLRQLCDAMDD